jgi:hypothetical protein
MLISGATGSIVDLMYGYYSACSKEVLASKLYTQQQQQQQKLLEQVQQQQQQSSDPSSR